MTRLILALDEPDFDRALRVLEATAAHVQWYKVGYEAFYGYGSRIIDALHACGKEIFLDLKLHDIPNTVAAGVRAVARHRASLLTVHAAGGYEMLSAAAAARDEVNAAGGELRLLAVTLLTSHTKEGLERVGVAREPHELVSMRAELAAGAGIDGAVCAVEEVPIVRGRTSAGFVVVCPGIRPAGADPGDQCRIATPLAAALAGADFIVVGRPIARAADPGAAARTMLDEMARTSPSGSGSLGAGP